MSFSLANARFRGANSLYLLRRFVTSLRQDGLRVTWQRLARALTPTQVASRLRIDLYFPEAAPFAAFALPCDQAPRVSIVIPVFNQAEHTLECLRAIAAHPPEATLEVIVVDDGSSDCTAEWMRQIAGLRYHRRTENGGFIASCNDGARLAQGTCLVFLNNDTVPQPGWLDAMLRTFDMEADVGLVGAQLVYPDGSLQEAGGVVFSDGSAWNYGRFESPYDPRFGYVRDADYCSGAAIAIPRGLFATLGGFDTRYAPAYYEDTDLAFAVRAAGKRVLYQPAACVVHKEGITAGTDTGSGTKAYQVRNAGLFAGKWQEVLSASRQPARFPIRPCCIGAPGKCWSSMRCCPSPIGTRARCACSTCCGCCARRVRMCVSSPPTPPMKKAMCRPSSNSASKSGTRPMQAPPRGSCRNRGRASTW